MRSDQQILEELTIVFQDVFDDDDIRVSAKTVASDVPEWDSLAHVRLMLSTQAAFNVKFSAADVTRLKSVGDLVVLIQKKLS
jgi:acyl carrier protein